MSSNGQPPPANASLRLFAYGQAGRPASRPADAWPARAGASRLQVIASSMENAMPKKLDQYKGRLSAERVAEGMTAAAENAARLASDAEFLLARGSVATALSLAAIAIEEAGKVAILRALSLARTDDEVRGCWKDYRCHTRKNVAWIFPELFAKGARKLSQFQPMYERGSDHPALLDNMKQLGFYTDCLGKARWARPIDAINADLASQIVLAATVMCRPSKHSTREVELWMEHVGPVWKKDASWMKKAVLDWQDAMHREGLSKTPVEKLAEFVWT